MGGPRYLPAGESALVVEFGTTADPALGARVRALDATLTAAAIAGVRESVPTYRSLMIHFDPRQTSASELIAALDGLEVSPDAARSPKCWRLPACYDEPYGEDLSELAGLLDRPADDIAELHATSVYRVAMYGFAPGFVFLDGLPEALSVSRRKTPRPPAPPGALTIANGQALIASIAMPTGWYMLGRTPARTFAAGRDPPFPIGVGDEVRFERVDAARFAELEREAEGGRDLLVAEA